MKDVALRRHSVRVDREGWCLGALVVHRESCSFTLGPHLWIRGNRYSLEGKMGSSDWDDESWERDEDSWTEAETHVSGKGRHRERKGGMKLGKDRGTPTKGGSSHLGSDDHYVSLPMSDARVRLQCPA